MQLSYFELLSPDPIPIPGIGGILSPTLKNISSIGIHTYQYYLTVLSMDAKTCFTMLGCPDQPGSVDNIFDLLLSHEQSVSLLQDVLNFFIKERVLYSAEDKCFFTRDKIPGTSSPMTGRITSKNYPLVSSLILQRNYIQPDSQEDLSKAKSPKAMEIMKKLQKGRNQMAKRNQTDGKTELGNIISAVAARDHSLNLLNIWDLTVFQLWDCFLRLTRNNIYDIRSVSTAVWGNRDDSFDTSEWFSLTYNT